MSEISSIINQTQDEGLPSPTAALGQHGEALAVAALKSEGYRIVITNFRVPIGRNSKGVQVTGEIDIIALDGETLCFIEVKTRRSEDFLPAIASVDRRKQRQIARTARVYRRLFAIENISQRYDVVTVIVGDVQAPEIEVIKGYWSDERLRKKKWYDGTWAE